MKIKPIFFTLFALFLVSCTAQTTAISISNTVKGNTGHRGIIPHEERNKPNEGKDYYNCTLTMNQNCTLEIVRLRVKIADGQVNLLPKFDDSQKKKKVKKGEIIYLNVEKDNDMKVEKSSMEEEGILFVKVNGRLKHIPIKAFKMILPM